MDIKTEREAFEAYMADRYKNTVDQRVCINSDGDYMAWDMQVAWHVWQAATAQVVPEGFILVKDEPVAYMVQNKFWKGEFEVKLLSEMPEPEFDGDSYDVEIPLYMIEAQEPSND